jgi:hypothetical protein
MTIDEGCVPRELLDAMFQIFALHLAKYFRINIKKYRNVPFNLMSAYQKEYL